MVKNLPAMQETRVQSLGQEDLLEKGMATHSSILAWRIPSTEEPCGLQVHRVTESDMTEWLFFFRFLKTIKTKFDCRNLYDTLPLIYPLKCTRLLRDYS